MARTWSNAKRTDTTSAVQRARNRPSGLTAFVGLLIFIVVLFVSIMTYVTVRTQRHPSTEVAQPATQNPKDE